MTEFEVFYEAEFTKDRSDPEYLAQAASEVQVGVRHLITGAAELGATLDPEKVAVEAVDRFEGDGLKRGMYIRAYVTKSTARPGCCPECGEKVEGWKAPLGGLAPEMWATLRERGIDPGSGHKASCSKAPWKP